eukprot:gene7373-13113_t
MSLKSVVKDLKKKGMISEACLNQLQHSLAGIPLEMMKRLTSQKKTGKGVKYSPEIKSFALTLQFYSAKPYEFVRRTFNYALPHQAQIRRWYSKIPAEAGFTEPSFLAIKRKVESSNEKVVLSLMLDEMSIRKHIAWDGTKFRGYVDLGCGNESDDSSSVAKEVLVFMAVSVNGAWKIPLAYFFIDGLSGAERANLINVCLQRIWDTGAKVVSVTCDGPSCHFSMMSELGAKLDPNDLKVSFPHPCDNTQILMAERFEKGEIVIDPEFGLNSEQETDSSDDEAQIDDSDDDVPLADLIPLSEVAKNDVAEHVYRWRADRTPPPQMSGEFKGNLEDNSSDESGDKIDEIKANRKGKNTKMSNPNKDAPFLDHTGINRPAANAESVLDHFLLFFPLHVVDKIVDETNTYYQQLRSEKQLSGEPFEMTREELLAFLGINIAMGLAKLPTIEDYWRKVPSTDFAKNTDFAGRRGSHKLFREVLVHQLVQPYLDKIANEEMTSKRMIEVAVKQRRVDDDVRLIGKHYVTKKRNKKKVQQLCL